MPARKNTLLQLLSFSLITIALPVSSVTPSHLPDFNGVPAPDPKPALAGNSRRRRAIMTLLDVLGELTKDEDLGAIGRWLLSFFVLLQQLIIACRWPRSAT